MNKNILFAGIFILIVGFGLFVFDKVFLGLFNVGTGIFLIFLNEYLNG